MNRKSFRQMFKNWREIYLIAFIVIITYMTIFLNPRRSFSLLEIIVLVVLGFVFLIIGVALAEYEKRKPTLFIKITYFVIMIPLASSITVLSDLSGAFWLIMMPLVSMTIIMLSRLWQVVVNILIIMALILPIALLTSSWDLFATNLLSFAAAVLFVAIFTEYAMREGKARLEVERLLGELGEANLKLREYAMQVEELAITKERNRLAREIHDSLGHYLTTINMQIEAAKALIDRDKPHALEALDTAQRLTRDGLSEVRRSVASLRALPFENRSLPEAISELVQENNSSGILTEFDVNGEVRQLGPQYDLALYRTVQEGLTNIRKHSLATTGALTLIYQPEKVSLTVQDNGVGTVENGHGFGLMGLKERIHLLGGEVKVETAPGNGFKLCVELPV
ncbi:MAG: sensor histidine kinase [Chloroflexi bacterium]|uniref:histidine kinase n=1 Tax=Candidatus Chlorohelix allophototropha TaxID=3003348 RepID=A0A8T7LVX0_9CHLR|nr:sensor histidine kinase [Chloroflexota bacterium]WJW66918.1 sensor histidine kinase [Chloroflexota bacterium L227-S17]